MAVLTKQEFRSRCFHSSVTAFSETNTFVLKKYPLAQCIKEDRFWKFDSDRDVALGADTIVAELIFDYLKP